ncbi:MAG: hypothetical protein mread185_000370 [Mycoplasmataceae bacterium]|nr:MAG: hypothetical protein mread185_000370 [Mycoplasmataceae bacterium]
MPTKVFCKQDKKGNFQHIKIKDHANFSDKGNDIVCSAISAITNGTINFLQINYGEICKITCNYVEIDIYLKDDNQGCQLCLRLMIFQLKNIANYYPNFLKIN